MSSDKYCHLSVNCFTPHSSKGGPSIVCQSRTTAAGQPRAVTKIADTPSSTTDFANKGKFKENEKEILQLFQYQFTRAYIDKYKYIYIYIYMCTKRQSYFYLQIRRSKYCYNRFFFLVEMRGITSYTLSWLSIEVNDFLAIDESAIICMTLRLINKLN